ncbi:MAG: hypothetical protein HFH72_13790 [Lachnospiraceae bacterium]|nr:hypothetical protein [Lachnospiraceae bacterium]
MIQIDEKDFNLLVNILFNDYFLDYLEEVIGDKNNELSVVTLFRGMDYFIEFSKKQLKTDGGMYRDD